MRFECVWPSIELLEYSVIIDHYGIVSINRIPIIITSYESWYDYYVRSNRANAYSTLKRFCLEHLAHVDTTFGKFMQALDLHACVQTRFLQSSTTIFR